LQQYGSVMDDLAAQRMFWQCGISRSIEARTTQVSILMGQLVWDIGGFPFWIYQQQATNR
jgi:hypothetical protein